MKLSIVIATEGIFKCCKNFEEGVKLALESGFDGIEPSIPNPWNFNIKGLKSLVKEKNLTISAFSTGLGFSKYGWDLASSSEEVRSEAVRAIFKHIDNAVELNAMVIIGLIRGRGEGDYSERKKLFYESILKCVEYAEKNSVTLLLEPLNRYETKLINNVDEALQFISMVGSRYLKLLLDTYHMNIEEYSIEGALVKASPHIGYIHIADSNRLPPGLGHINFRNVIEVLKALSYRGFLSAEVIFRESPKKVFEKTSKFMKILLEDST